jgi:hypothetical protein
MVVHVFHTFEKSNSRFSQKCQTIDWLGVYTAIFSDAHIKTKYYLQQMATTLINIYKCTYVKTANEMKCTK